MSVGLSRIDLILHNLKRDPLKIQHPKFENSRLGFIEYVHESLERLIGSMMVLRPRQGQYLLYVLKPEHLFYFSKMLKKFCSCKPRPDVITVVPKILYITMIDSLRQL